MKFDVKINKWGANKNTTSDFILLKLLIHFVTNDQYAIANIGKSCLKRDMYKSRSYPPTLHYHIIILHA